MKIRKSQLIIIFVILAADIITKLIIKKNLEYHESITVIDGIFNIVYVLNPGAAFGFLRNLDDSYRQIFFVVVTIIAIAGIAFFMIKEKNVWNYSAYSAVAAGALGNLLDRIHTGFVVDFFDFHIGDKYHWPAFNIADISISVGIGMLLIDIIFLAKKRKAKEEF